MKKLLLITLISLFASALAVTTLLAQQADSSSTSETQTSSRSDSLYRRAKPRIDFVTIAEFYLPDGQAVSGRLISEDKNQIVIEEFVESTLTTRSYSKREIDSRSLSKRKIPESKHYTQIADYFAARTWDFRDDPDDFIQAIRAYEKARQILQDSDRAEDQQIAQVDRAIAKLNEDRRVWTREVESRAKLKDLEFEAELPKRLKQIERLLAENAVRLDESIKFVERTVADLKADNRAIQENLARMNKEFTQQIRILDTRILENRASINNLWYRGFIVPGSGGSTN